MIITGVQGSGKTTACNYLSQKYNSKVIENWGMLNDIAKNNLRFAADPFSNFFDQVSSNQNKFSLHDYRDILTECANNDHIIYHMGVIETAIFKILDLDCTIIAIDTDTSIRYDRISKRNVWTIEETKHYYSTVFPGYERALNAVIPLADHIISNNADIETFYSELDNLELSNWEQK